MELREQVKQNRNNIRAQLKLLNVGQKPYELGGSASAGLVMEKSDRKQDAELFLQQVLNQKCTIENSFDELFITREKLGQGAQSVVRKVQERSTKKEFAAKIIRNVDAEKIHNIKHQYKMLKALDFPTIVKAHYLFIEEQESVCRLVLEYCPWRQLKSQLDEFGVFTEDLTAELIKTLLQTVDYLHKLGVCHRDIKPQNILYSLMDSPPLKLIDFEISKLNKNPKIEMWTVTGSLFYKAPEMFAGSYSNKIDIWAVGIVAYELLHGHPPFMKEYVDETIDDICNTSIEAIIRPDISPFAQQFIKKCLCKDPDQRLSAADSLKHPFILQASNSSVTPKEDKLNSSFGDKCKVGFYEKQTEEQASPAKRENAWIKRASLQTTLLGLKQSKQHSGFLDHEMGIKVVTKSPTK